ncbi:flagellar biosynthesis anti-sigma factor FlgM [Ferriphaselus sp. R-1]|uniref:flagellar biosynthesis anti-sigma factor FlgM n=1 Tax=Ferriphaselus sp. R-1 TaxID=1485544 RepID=UPI000557AE8D|nr:flagellar biosynthesis anti-sigma factor FlgM [Ferriphaselus sp. R-1]
MKIEKTSSKPIAPAHAGDGGRPSATTRGGPASSNSGSSTAVHLGATSAQLRSMESSMAGTPVVDVAKVAEIKQAISEGRFQINSGVVADRLIASARELLGADTRQ